MVSDLKFRPTFGPRYTMYNAVDEEFKRVAELSIQEIIHRNVIADYSFRVKGGSTKWYTLYPVDEEYSFYTGEVILNEINPQLGNLTVENMVFFLKTTAKVAGEYFFAQNDAELRILKGFNFRAIATHIKEESEYWLVLVF